MAFGKKLAYIVKVNDVRDIPGADRIQLASVMDYTVIIKKKNTSPATLDFMLRLVPCFLMDFLLKIRSLTQQ